MFITKIQKFKLSYCFDAMVVVISILREHVVGF